MLRKGRIEYEQQSADDKEKDNGKYRHEEKFLRSSFCEKQFPVRKEHFREAITEEKSEQRH